MDSKSWPNAKGATRLNFIHRMTWIARAKYVHKFVTVGALQTDKPAEMMYLRDQVFSAYTMRTLDSCVNFGIRPIFAFDEVKRGKKNGWAEECMIGIRRYPLFVWFSRGAHVAEIMHVEPGSTIESKLADCIAYVTAREFYLRKSGKNVDVNTQLYGYSHFSGFNGDGDFISSDGVGFPWRKIYGLNTQR